VEDNRGFPYYDFTIDEYEECLETFYKAFKKPMILTEFGADAIAGMHSYPAQPFSEEFQSEVVEKQYKRLLKLDYVFGAHVWNFADFKTSETITRIIYNRKGAFTRERHPKLLAHTLRRLWKDEEE